MKKFLVFVSLLFFCSHCSVKRKFEAEASLPVDPYQKTSLPVTCESETLPDKTVTLTRVPSNYTYLFEAYCPKQGIRSQREDITKPLNMIFVVDITNSMGSSIEAIRAIITDLVRELKLYKWDVEFAAIGFADVISEFRIIDFENVEKFQFDLGQWKDHLIDGRDFQEAGQQGISLALDKLKAYKRPNFTAEETFNVIVYVTDAPAYTENSIDHSDFSINALAKRFKKVQIPNLQFFYSTPDQVRPEEKVSQAPEPLAQMTNLVQQAGLVDHKLNFPPGTEILTSFSKQYVEVVQDEEGSCSLESVNFISSREGVPSSDKRAGPELLKIAEAKKTILFTTSSDPKIKHYYLIVSRCCKKEPTAKECEGFDTSNFHFIFEPQGS